MNMRNEEDYKAQGFPGFTCKCGKHKYPSEELCANCQSSRIIRVEEGKTWNQKQLR